MTLPTGPITDTDMARILLVGIRLVNATNAWVADQKLPFSADKAREQDSQLAYLAWDNALRRAEETHANVLDRFKVWGLSESCKPNAYAVLHEIGTLAEFHSKYLKLGEEPDPRRTNRRNPL